MTEFSAPADWTFKPGKLPARPGAIKFALFNYFNLDLPKPPEHFRHKDPPTWHDYANKKYGSCVWAGAANETLLWEHEGGLRDESVELFTEDTVLSDYSAVTGFDPKRPETDKGTSMSRAAAYRRKYGIHDANGNRHIVDAYAWVGLRNMKYLRAAVWVLGGVGLGFQFPDYAMNQFKNNKPWSVEPGQVQGGHYVPCVGVAPNGNLICVSWGKEQEMTPEFYVQYADEVTGFIDLDRLNLTSKLSPEGFNEARLKHDLGSVSSGSVYAQLEEPTNWA